MQKNSRRTIVFRLMFGFCATYMFFSIKSLQLQIESKNSASPWAKLVFVLQICTSKCTTKQLISCFVAIKKFIYSLIYNSYMYIGTYTIFLIRYGESFSLMKDLVSVYPEDIF